MKKKVILTILITILLFPGFIHGAIPASERAALIALYNSTNGDNWVNKTGWKTPPLHTDGFAKPGTEGNWYGVTLSGDNVRNLILNKNKLCGSIPPELGNLSHLIVLRLRENQLSGCIPPELGKLSRLGDLDLCKNQLSGSIPSELGNLQILRNLDLSYNRLSDSIPPGLGYLDCLEGLILNWNQLSGSIPSELAWLDDLWYLDLNNNKLSGEIPYLNTLPKFVLVDIGYNCLYSTNPEVRDWLNNHDPDWETHQNQCGEVNIPTVSTNSVSSITSKSAVCGGNVSSNGGAPVKNRGICWSTSLSPTIADSKTTDGTGTGSFTSNITGLNPDTTYYVRAYATNSRGTAYGSNMSFKTNPPEIPTIWLNHTTLNFGSSIYGSVTAPQTVLVSNTGTGTLNWSASGSAAWLSFTPTSGTGDTILSVSVDPSGLAVGNYTGTITISDSNAANSPQAITVSLHVYDQGQTSAPFGEFATPLDGAVVSGSISVTGWALDDIGVRGVYIYNLNTIIGVADFVEGARPDIETAYPSYPNNYKAGWGYMLLTNCLPNGGNGTYTITAKATDIEGNEITLGSKTITVDNTHAVNPFGALDSPIAGGTASGKAFVNAGWALTPQPNSIPMDGSTINVVIDGVVKGHPVYNVFRSDIATLFPGYANTDGAVGYSHIDTTKFKNGLHTIAWIVSDSGGNSDGIGSRYFTVQNSGNPGFSRGEPPCSPVFDPCLPVFDSYSPTHDEIKTVEIQELERVEINLSDDGVYEGYIVVGDQLRELPIGSTLDRQRGVFYWQPGPGFVGEYRLVFIEKDNEGQLTRKSVVVNIKPKQ